MVKTSVESAPPQPMASFAAASDNPAAGEAVDQLVTHVLAEDHIITNIALNKTVRMSSSASADPKYASLAVDGSEETFVESTLEKYDPYLVIDLGSESYIDEIIVISPHELGDIAAYVTDIKSLASSRNTSGLNERSNWHTSALVVGSRVTLHAHTTGRYVRIQKTSSASKLVVSEVVVRGLHLNPREKLFSQCLSGHDGTEVCSSRGVCAQGRCNCGAFYSGLRCERVRMSVFTTFISFMVVVAGLCMLRKRLRFRCLKKRRNGFKKLDTESADSGSDCEYGSNDSLDQQQHRIVSKGSSGSSFNYGPEEVSRSRSPVPSSLPIQRPSSHDQILSPPPLPPQYKLHVLFSTPLVLFTHSEVIPVAQLDVERECELLNRSLAQAGAQGRVKLEVTCATVDALQSVLTLREASVLHVSSHCQPDLIALEDANGAAHLVSIEALSNLLVAAKPAVHSSRLVVLNCCHSAGVARAFVEAGFEHVVCLSEHLRVRDVTAATFTRAFYLALASAHTVGDAFRIAKEAVSLCPNAMPGESNAFQLLPEHAPHDEVIWPRYHHQGASPTPRAWSPVPLFANPCQIPPRCEDFVGRSHEMWTILQMLQRYRLVNVYGPRGSGKSAMLVQLANHIRIRKSEALFSDGLFFIGLDHRVQMDMQDDDFSHELLCGYIAESLAQASMGHNTSNIQNASSKSSASASAVVSPHNTLRRSISKTNREAALVKFAAERPTSLIIIDGASASLLESKAFLDCLSTLVKASPKLHIITASESRFEQPSLRVINVLCGPLSDLDAARLLIKLCHPKLLPPDVQRTEIYEAQPWEDEDDEFETTARALAQCSAIRSLMGHAANVRKLANVINVRAGMGQIFSFKDHELNLADLVY